MTVLILLAACLPIAAGLLQFFLSEKKKKISEISLFSSMIGSAVCVVILICADLFGQSTLFRITDTLCVTLRADVLGTLFACVEIFVFLLIAVFSHSYFEGDGAVVRFRGFCLLTLGAILLLSFSGNALTMYVCFEAVTLCSMPLVLHDKTKESIDAALKYLLYSVGGAFLGLIGIIYFSLHATADGFALGGVIDSSIAGTSAFSVILLLTLIGFGAKCGMFPLHNWLPTAHPVAPAPASALLSAIITKSGVFVILRLVLYVVGTDAMKSTVSSKIWLGLILFTVFLGSAMAVIQKNFKRRLAFSTVSQVSYVLLGIAVLTPSGLSGAILQFVSHALIKTGLFLCAGAVIHLTGKHDVDEFSGMAKELPVTVWCYTILSLGLVGVPPTSGFVAKWYLATGALDSEMGVLSVLAPIVLILSAILTAYYLLSVTVAAFFPPKDAPVLERKKEPIPMCAVLILLTVLSVAVGLWPSALSDLPALF